MTMSQLVSRILLAIFVFPLGAIFYMVLFIVLEEGILRSNSGYYRERETWCFLIAGGLTWAAVALYWWLLWRSTVRWTHGRIVGTAGAVLFAAVAGAIVGAVCATLFPSGGESFGAFVGSVLAILLWMIATIFLWRETATERGQRVSGAHNAITCPTCGYNMTGLGESRCPECGSKFTLDELLASQASSAAAADIS
jgi:hypothetical protein